MQKHRFWPTLLIKAHGPFKTLVDLGWCVADLQPLHPRLRACSTVTNVDQILSLECHIFLRDSFSLVTHTNISTVMRDHPIHGLDGLFGTSYHLPCAGIHDNIIIKKRHHCTSVSLCMLSVMNNSAHVHCHCDHKV